MRNPENDRASESMRAILRIRPRSHFPIKERGRIAAGDRPPLACSEHAGSAVQIGHGVGQKSPVQSRMHAENLMQDQARGSKFGGKRAGTKVAS